MSRSIRFVLPLLLILPSTVALAQTPYVEFEPGPPTTGPEIGGGAVEWPEGRINYLFELDQIAAFLAVWQYLEPGPNFGGMIEAEAGPLGNVIQTDNTLEAIWVWSRYTELTGSVDYLDNIADAWTYCLNFPPWLEEGGDGYYRVHNAAWGLTAESAYRSATGDDGFLSFAATCADYIVGIDLFLNQFQKLNAFVQGWACGNLYLYGEEMANDTWKDAALLQGEELVEWVDYDPPVQLASETWAMSSGTLVWGICSSVFRDDPLRGAQWVADYGALVDTFQVWYDNPGDNFDWDNAWNVAYVNAHFAMGDVSGDPAYTSFGEKLTRQLLSYDTDDDGGIPSTTQDPVTEDMSWVTSYLAKFGVARLLGEPPLVDAGLLEFLSPTDGDTLIWPPDAPVSIQVLATNFGLEDLPDVDVVLTGGASGETAISLDFVEKEIVGLNPFWIPPGPGDYELVAYTSVPGDEDPSNDSLSIVIHVLDAAAAPEVADAKTASGLERVWPNPSSGVAWISLSIPEGERATVDVVTVGGRRVSGWTIPPGAAGRIVRPWDGRDGAGRSLPSGVYYVRARVGGIESSLPVIRLGR